MTVLPRLVVISARWPAGMPVTVWNCLWRTIVFERRNTARIPATPGSFRLLTLDGQLEAGQIE